MQKLSVFLSFDQHNFPYPLSSGKSDVAKKVPESDMAQCPGTYQLPETFWFLFVITFCVVYNTRRIATILRYVIVEEILIPSFLFDA